MRYAIIAMIVLTIIGIILSLRNDIKCRQLETAIRFCRKVVNLQEIYAEIQKIEQEGTDGIYDIEGKYYKVEYDTNNPKQIFEQIEYGIIDARCEHDIIQDKENDFTVEDWEFIEEHFNKLEKLNQEIRYETWKRGFRKV